MKVIQVTNSLVMDENSYILTDETTGITAVVDPNFDDKTMKDIVESYDVKFILLTHGHFDHIYSANTLKNKTGAKIYAHENEVELLKKPSVNLSIMIKQNLSTSADVLFKEGDIIKIGDTNVEVIHTPGHTAGCSTFRFDNVLITGDMVFKGCIGRVDFPTSSIPDMIKSMKKLRALEEDYVIYSGHGDATTLNHEKIPQNNREFAYKG